MRSTKEKYNKRKPNKKEHLLSNQYHLPTNHISAKKEEKGKRFACPKESRPPKHEFSKRKGAKFKAEYLKGKIKRAQ